MAAVSSVDPFPVAPAVVTLVVAAKAIACTATKTDTHKNLRIRRCEKLRLGVECLLGLVNCFPLFVIMYAELQVSLGTKYVC